MKEYDTIIVGGGVWGVSISYYLARFGAKRVLLLDRGSLGSGATGRSSGIIRQKYDDPVLAKMAYDSLRIFKDFQKQVGGDPEFRQRGYLAASGDAEKLDSAVKALRALGINARVLSAGEAKSIEPELATDDVEAFSYEEEAGVANPTSTLLSYARAAAKLGVEIKEHTAVKKINVANGKVSGVTTGSSELSSPIVVDAAGAWSGLLAITAGVEIPVKPVVRYMLILRCPEAMRPLRSVVSDETTNVYVMPQGDASRHVLVGRGSETMSLKNTPDANPEGFSSLVPGEIKSEMTEKSVRRFPGLRSAELTGEYTGIVDYTPDKRPLLCGSDSLDGLYLACGSSSHGFKLTPMVGRAMAELIAHGSTKLVDLRHFDVGRFRS